MIPFARLRLPAAAMLLLAACNDSPTAPVPAQLELVQAPAAAGAPGAALADTLKVRLATADGTPRSGVRVFWQVRLGSGSLQPIADTTDAEGVAMAIWTLGLELGPNEARASTLDESAVTFAANGEAFRVDRLAADWRIACGLVSGALWCWGQYFWANAPPVSVYESGTPYYRWENVSPALVDDSHEFTDVAVSTDVVCARDVQAIVWCASAGSPVPTQVAGLPPIQGGLVGRGQSEFCGIAEGDLSAWCWSAGVPPAQIPGSPAFLRIWLSASPRVACGIVTDGSTACWGDGKLGNGTADSSSTPVPVSGAHQFVELGLARHSSCGRTSLGEIWCWDGSEMLVPTFTRGGATLLAAGDWWVITEGVGADLERWYGPTFSPEPPVGLSEVPVRDFGTQGIACARLAGGEVYCNEEMWNRQSGLYYHIYHAVPPAYRSPPSTRLP